MSLTEPYYWKEVLHGRFDGFARQPQRQTKRGATCPDGKKHHKGCKCQVLVNGRAIRRGDNDMTPADLVVIR